ncbi:MAG: hypothetical protein R6W96_03230 [Clostridia bacterium]
MTDIKKKYLEAIVSENQQRGINGIYLELARMETGLSGDVANLRESMEYIRGRGDCYDFILPGFLAMAARHGIGEENASLILGSKYWIDQGGHEKSPCYFTENHQILFHATEYVAGTLYPDECFSNTGKTGNWHAGHARPFITRWLDARMRFGFCEWLSNCYYHEDALALALLQMIPGDEDMKKQSSAVLDLIFLDMALNSFKGVFGSSHGRAYGRDILRGKDSTRPLRELFLYESTATAGFSPACILLCLSDKEIHGVIRDIASHQGTQENKQCMSLDPGEGEAFGVDPSDSKNLGLYWGMGAFCHRQVIENTLKVQAEPGYYLLERAKAHKEWFDLCEAGGIQTPEDADYTSTTKANLYTYKTRDYMLSCVQDFKKGRFGFQQHVWQATLGENIPVFTTHPGSNEYNARPNNWAGNRILPKVHQHRNVLVCLYEMPLSLLADFTYVTHAYFPKGQMDEAREENGWFFGRKGNGLVALRPLKGPVYLGTPDKDLAKYLGQSEEMDDTPYEIIAFGRSNAWILEMGSLKEWKSFGDFIRAVADAGLGGDVAGLTYESPSLGTVQTGWDQPLMVGGERINTGDYPRYDSPFAKAERGDRKILVTCGDASMTISSEQNKED